MPSTVAVAVAAVLANQVAARRLSVKLLMENWRKYLLTESIDSRIMKQIDKAQEMGCIIYVNDGQNAGWVEIVETASNLSAGKVEWEYSAGQYGSCNGAAVVELAKSDEGLGPLAYDVAIEVSGGLTSDRKEVSDEAEQVWKTYVDSRKDVEIDQLDVHKDYGYDQLTPDNANDDCDQIPATQRYKGQWSDSALSKVVYKKGRPVVDELQSRGMLKMVAAEGRDFQKDSSYIKDHEGNKEELIGDGGQDNSEPYEKNPIKKRSKGAPPAG